VKIGVFRKKIGQSNPQKPSKEPKNKLKKSGNPAKHRQKKAARPKKTKKALTSGLSMETVKQLLDSTGKTLAKIRVDRLSVDVTVGHDDPADAAIRYGKMQMLWHGGIVPLVYKIGIKPSDVRFYLDFDAERITAEGEIRISIKIRHLLKLAFSYLKLYIITKKGDE